MITAFLPCRAGSERVPNKNTRAFGGHSDGLVGLKVRQLSLCPQVDRIVLSTNDPVVIELAESVDIARGKLAIDHRPTELCQSSTSTDDLIRYVPSVVESGSVLWTHVTSPFVESRDYTEIIRAYQSSVDGGTADSLMTVTHVQEFLWSQDGPINYDRAVEKWPRTQTISPVYSVNSAAFMIDVGLMSRLGDRIGRAPLLLELRGLKGFDIDWEAQFDVADMLYRRGDSLRQQRQQ